MGKQTFNPYYSYPRPRQHSGIAQAEMKSKFRLTRQYLLRFEEIVRKRSGYVKYFDPKKDPFWTV